MSKGTRAPLLTIVCGSLLALASCQKRAAQQAQGGNDGGPSDAGTDAGAGIDSDAGTGISSDGSPTGGDAGVISGVTN